MEFTAKDLESWRPKSLRGVGRPKKETKQFSIRCYPEDLPAIRAFCKALINKRESK